MEEVSIRVRTSNRLQLNLTVCLSQTVADLKEILSRRTNVPPVQQRLIYQGRQLKDEEVLTDCKVAADHVLQMITSESRPITPERSPEPSAPRSLFSLELRAEFPVARMRRRSEQRFQELSEEIRTEAVAQNLISIESLLKARNDPAERPLDPFDLAKRRFKPGQWVDLLDTANQWLEGQIIQVHTHVEALPSVHVHYNGWPARWDEWLSTDSSRIQLFATRTGCTPRHLAQMYSPYPRRSPDSPVSDLLRIELPEMVQRAGRILAAVNLLVKRYTELQVEQLLQQYPEGELELLSVQLSVVLDRTGRMVTDLGRAMERGDAQLATMLTQAELAQVEDDAPRILNWTLFDSSE